MLNSHRTFVESVRNYCGLHGIAVEMKSQGWLIIMQRGPKRHFAFGYDLGLNHAVAHQIAKDKVATAEVLQFCNVPCVPHTLFLSPEMNAYVPPARSWEAMLQHLRENPQGIVLKPNEGTSGLQVYKVRSEPELELAAHRIFASHLGLAISPFVEIEDEIRVVVLDGHPVNVYKKHRPSVVGDGRHSLLELALAATPVEARSSVLPAMADEFDKATLDRVPASGECHVLNWRHNLDSGAQPIVLEAEAIPQDCIRIAIDAAKAIDIRFASIDVVQVNGAWQILEINAGVMMEALSRSHPELVDATYNAALDKIFG